jgi:ABC-type Fe3+/spermidine/putrescine transport system ATPase subunit
MSIVLEGVTKRYGQHTVVNDVSLEIKMVSFLCCSAPAAAERPQS